MNALPLTAYPAIGDEDQQPSQLLAAQNPFPFPSAYARSESLKVAWDCICEQSLRNGDENPGLIHQ